MRRDGVENAQAGANAALAESLDRVTTVETTKNKHAMHRQTAMRKTSTVDVVMRSLINRCKEETERSDEPKNARRTPQRLQALQ